MNLNLIFVLFLSSLLTVFFISNLSPIAHKIKLVDQPNNRKNHQGNIPLIGGISIALSFTISILTLNMSLSDFRALLAAFLLMIIVGLLDDFNEISPRSRILAQIIAALFMTCWGNILLTHLGHLFSFHADFSLGNWAFPVTILLIIALINAVNMLDGLDGLAGASTLISLLSLFIVAYYSHAYAEMQLIAILAACIVSFLYFNFPLGNLKSRLIFLGDAGSTSLGLMLAWFGIQLSQLPNTLLQPGYLPWFFLLPIFDLTTVTLRRIFIKHTSPFIADREHIHHMLEKMRVSTRVITYLLTAIAALSNLLALIMIYFQIPALFSLIGFIILFFTYFYYASNFWHNKKLV